MKVLRIRYNLYAGTEPLSLSVYEPITIQILLGERPPFFGRVELECRVCYPLKVLCSWYNLFDGTEMLSISVYDPITINILLGGTVPQFGGWG